MFFPDSIWNLIKEYNNDYINDYRKWKSLSHGHQNDWISGGNTLNSSFNALSNNYFTNIRPLVYTRTPLPLLEIPSKEENIDTHTIDTFTYNENYKYRYIKYNIIQYRDKLSYNFSISDISDIDYIDIEIGNSVIEKLYPRYFDCLRYIYDIPIKDDNNYYIIPFWTSKIGVPYCMYHLLYIKVYYKRNISNNIIIKYKTKDLDTLLNESSYVTYQIQYNDYLGNKGIQMLHLNHMMIALIVKTTNIYYSMKLNDEIIYFKKTKQIGDYGIFSVISNIKNIMNETERLINFSRIDRVCIKEPIDIIIISINGIKYMNGMGGLMYAF